MSCVYCLVVVVDDDNDVVVTAIAVAAVAFSRAVAGVAVGLNCGIEMTPYAIRRCNQAVLPGVVFEKYSSGSVECKLFVGSTSTSS